MSQISLNSPCPCGSGKKYKRCCGAAEGQPTKSAAGGRATLQRLVATALQYQQAGQPAEAERILNRALLISPGDSGLLGFRGMMAFEQGRLDEAERFIQRAIEINQADSRLYNFLGQVKTEQGRHVDAERAFGRAIMLDGNFAEAWCNMAYVQMLRHNPEEAIPSIQKAIELMPTDGDLHIQLGKAHFLMRNLRQAEQAFQKAVDLGAHSGTVSLWLSACLRAQGQLEQAEQHEAQGLSRFDQEAVLFQALMELGRTEVHVGRMTEAEHWLRKAIDMQPELSAPYVDMAGARKFMEADRPWVDKMESLAMAGDGSGQRGLEFALGKVYTDLGDYDRSFFHYRAGNNIVRQTVPFDKAKYIADITRIIEWCTPERLADLPKGSDSDVPILIVGTPRSGTTLTEQIISSHSAVDGAGEMDFWTRLAPTLMERYNANLAGEVAEGYLALMRQHSETAQHITDKMPGNYQYLGLIHAVFPNAKIVHCRRHPMDACLSIYFQNFPDGHAYKWDLDSLVVFYEQYQRIMEHWRAVLPAGTMFELKYEDMVEDMPTVSRSLMTFLGLEWEEGQLDFHKKERAVFTASKWQARQPIYKTSKERWRRYEKHLGPLLSLLKYA